MEAKKVLLLHGNQCSEPIHSQDDVELNHVNDYQRYLKLAFCYYYVPSLILSSAIIIVPAGVDTTRLYSKGSIYPYSCLSNE